MLCGHENVFPSQKFVPYCLLSFPNDEQYKMMNHEHSRNKKYLKRKATWDEPIDKVQP